MEDKQIIELYWNRSDDAIKETKEKYGQYCVYIAHHILQDKELAALCVKQSYEKLWETIPPRKPQNLKAYLCKITRNLALHMKYPELNEQNTDLFTAELVIHDFLKSLEPEQRNLFVAYYWYFTSVSEIATQYKKNENKVNELLDSLRQKLENALKEKNIHLQTEAGLLYAMTEIEDRYLDEAAPQKVVHEEKSEMPNHEHKTSFLQIWKRYQIPIIACLLFLIILVFIWPKTSVEQNPTESETEETGHGTTVDIIDLENLITIFSGGSYHKDDLAAMKEMLPWQENMEIVALPVYKNISFYNEETLIAKVTDIAHKLDMNIISMNIISGQSTVQRIEAITDKGSIQMDARGKITVTYDGEVHLLNKCEMSDSASIKEANENVGRLMMEFGGAMGIDHFDTISFPQYDSAGNRSMNYRVVVADLYRNDVKQMLNYAFNQVEFYYKEDIGLTGFSYGDIRVATEEMGYYPIISLEEAKHLLQEGNYSSEIFDSVQANFVYKEEDVLGVELMYKTGEQETYYQPYYCFYIYVEQVKEYVRFYVPAIKGAHADDKELVQPEFKIIDLNGYQFLTTLGYEKDGKYYSIVNGELKEVEEIELFDNPDKYGEVWGDMGTESIVYYFCYGDSEELNLTELMNELAPDKKYDQLDAMYIDGKILIIGWEYGADASQPYYSTQYLYSVEKNTLTQVMERTPRYVETVCPHGITYYGGRYATNRNTDGMLWIIELISGKSVNTGIRNEDIRLIENASNEHYVVVLQTGEIVIVEKASGDIVKKTKAQFSYTYMTIRYKDGLVYIEPGDALVFVISEFES